MSTVLLLLLLLLLLFFAARRHFQKAKEAPVLRRTSNPQFSVSAGVDVRASTEGNGAVTARYASSGAAAAGNTTYTAMSIQEDEKVITSYAGSGAAAAGDAMYAALATGTEQAQDYADVGAGNTGAVGGDDHVYEAPYGIAHVASNDNAELSACDDGDTVAAAVTAGSASDAGSQTATFATLPTRPEQEADKVVARYASSSAAAAGDSMYAALATGTEQAQDYAAYADVGAGNTRAVGGDDHLYEAPYGIAHVASNDNAELSACDDGDTVAAAVTAGSASDAGSQTATFATLPTRPKQEADNFVARYASSGAAAAGDSMYAALATKGQENATRGDADVDGHMYDDPDPVSNDNAEYATCDDDETVTARYASSRAAAAGNFTYEMLSPVTDAGDDEDSGQYKDVAPTFMPVLQQHHGPDAGEVAAKKADDVYEYTDDVRNLVGTPVSPAAGGQQRQPSDGYAGLSFG